MEADFECPHCPYGLAKASLGVPGAAVRFLSLMYVHMLSHEPPERRDDPKVHADLRHMLGTAVLRQYEQAGAAALSEAFIEEWGGSEN
jgi:hypothetical protein